MKKPLIIRACLAALALIVCVAAAVPEKPTGWQYHVIVNPGHTLIEQSLNRAAKDGWEFASLSFTPDGTAVAVVRKPAKQ